MRKRKNPNFLFAVFMTVLCLTLAGCKEQPENGPHRIETNRYTAHFPDAFDTQTTIIGYAENEETFQQKVEMIKEKLMFYHRLYDIYHSYEGISNIKTINENAGVRPVTVDQEIIELLKISKAMYEETMGQVNVAMGSVLSIWHDYREFGRENPEQASIPDMDILVNASRHTDISNLILDEEESTVYLKDAKMLLDVGGIGKGYAVQKTIEYAKEIGMKNALISVGGNVGAIGKKQDGELWKIGIQNPDMDSEERYVEKVSVADKCIVTSGDYQRYYMADDVKYCHIIDPDTLMPANYFASVTIITEDSGLADALSTALYNMPLEEGMAYINGRDDVEAMWVRKDGSVACSDYFYAYKK